MKKKIWIINQYSTSMGYEKGGRYYWFAKYLKIEGYEPVIITANTFHNSSKIIETGNNKFIKEVINDITFVFVKTIVALKNDIRRILNMVIFYWNLLSVSMKLVKYIGKPDIILASSPHPLVMIAGIKIAKKLKIPCLCDIQDLWPEAIFEFGFLKKNSILGKLMLKGEHWIYDKADGLIFTKEGELEYISEMKWDLANGGVINTDKTHFLTIGVDLDDFNEYKSTYTIDNDKDLDSDKFKVIYTGTIRAVNNVNKILETALLLRDCHDSLFIIYGSGFEKDALEKRANDLNLTNIVFKGRVDKKYIPYILSKSSVNLLNYKQTGYYLKRGDSSNKLFEYLASGKPIISSVKMGYSLIQKYNCGIEIYDATPEQICDAISEIKNLPKPEYDKLCFNSSLAAKDFDVKDLSQQLIKIIENS